MRTARTILEEEGEIPGDLQPDLPPQGGRRPKSREQIKDLFYKLQSHNVGRERLEEFMEHEAVSAYGMYRGEPCGGRIEYASNDNDFLHQANREYLLARYNFLGRSADIDTRHFNDQEDFFTDLALVDDDVWESFIEDLDSLTQYPCLDEERMSELEMEAQDEWVRENGVDEFQKEAKDKTAFQSSFAQWAIEHVSEDQVFEMIRDSEASWDMEDGAAWISMDRVIDRLDDPLSYVLTKDGRDLEPAMRKRFAKVKAWGFHHILLPIFEQEIRKLWMNDPDVYSQYARRSEWELFQIVLAATPDSNWDSGDPAWYPDTKEIEGRRRYFWTVGLDASGGDTQEAMALIAERFPELVQKVTGEDPNQLQLGLPESLEEGVNIRDDPLGWFKSLGQEVVYKDDQMTLRRVTEPSVIRMYVTGVDQAHPLFHDEGVWEKRTGHYHVVDYVLSAAGGHYWISEHIRDGLLNGEVGPQGRGTTVLKAALDEPGVREGLIAYYTQRVIEAEDEDERTYLAKIIWQLGGMATLSRLRRKFKDLDVPGYRFMAGLAYGKEGKLRSARRYLQDRENKVTAKGVWVLFDDWEETVEFFPEDERRTAEMVLSGDAHQLFDDYGMNDLRIGDITSFLGPKEWQRMRELLANRPFVDDDGEDRIMRKADLDALDERELERFADSFVEDCFKDIADALRHAHADATAEASEHYMWRYYKDAVIMATGATANKYIVVGQSPGSQHVGPHPIHKLALFYPWDVIEKILAAYGEEDQHGYGGVTEPWTGTVKELIVRHAPRAEVGRDDFWASPTRDEVQSAVERQLDLLDVTPLQRQPEAPGQQVLPLGDSQAAKDIAGRLLEEENYDYSCLMLELPREQAGFAMEWAKANIPDENVYVDPKDGGKGREDEMHVTIKWGLQIREPNQVLTDLLARTRAFPVKLGRVSLFQKDDCDVVKLEVESPWLVALHARVKGAVANTDTHPSFQPHCTLAYVKKGTADNLVGQEVFGGLPGAPDSTFYCYEVIFQAPGEKGDADRTTKLPLLRDNGVEGEREDKEEEQGTAAVAEARTKPEPDPFGALPFPSDPSRLRSGIKRRKKAKAILR